MTAAEGAERVAARQHAAQHATATQGGEVADENEEATELTGVDGDSDEEEDENPYTCESCGGHAFRVTRSFVRTQTRTDTLPCTCEDALGEAVVREVCVMTAIEWSGILGPDHRVEEWDENEELDTNEDQIDEHVACERCAQEHDPGEWEHELSDDIEEEDEEIYVHCDACSHEIEFGYSHPGLGRIWPCEASAFKPRMCFPDDRYREHWAKLGWLRPERR